MCTRVLPTWQALEPFPPACIPAFAPCAISGLSRMLPVAPPGWGQAPLTSCGCEKCEGVQRCGCEKV